MKITEAKVGMRVRLKDDPSKTFKVVFVGTTCLRVLPEQPKPIDVYVELVEPVTEEQKPLL